MLIVSGFIASVNVALTAWFSATPVAALAGVVDTIKGLVVFRVEPVVNVHT